MAWRFAADVVVVIHAAFIVFVVAGGLAVARHPRLAWVHVPVAVYGIVIQLVGFTCPLTPLEKWLRGRAGSAGYEGGFVEQYVVPVIYPGEFTPTVQLVLAALVLVVNLGAYTFVWRRRGRADRPPPTSDSATVGASAGGIGTERGVDDGGSGGRRAVEAGTVIVAAQQEEHQCDGDREEQHEAEAERDEAGVAPPWRR